MGIQYQGKEEEGSQRWADACKRDMTEAGLKEDNATNRAEWRNKIKSYTGDPRARNKPRTKKKQDLRVWELTVIN